MLKKFVRVHPEFVAGLQKFIQDYLEFIAGLQKFIQNHLDFIAGLNNRNRIVFRQLKKNFPNYKE